MKAPKSKKVKPRKPRKKETLSRQKITRRKKTCKTCEKLLGSEIYQYLIQHSGNVIIYLSPDHRIIEWNREAERIYGWKREKVLGKDYFKLFIPEDVRNDVAADMNKVLRGELTRGFESKVFTHDRKERILAWYLDCIFDTKREPCGIIAVGQDITERKKAEEALRESETRYRSLFEQSSEAIFILEVEGPQAGKILSTNKAAYLMHGYTKKEILRLSITDLVTPEFAAKAPKYIKRILAGETLKFQSMHKQKDGTVFPIEASVALMKAGGKKLILSIFRNISQRRQAEEERGRLIKKLKYMSQTDGLTGLSNRQYLNMRLAQEIRRAKRYGNPLSLIMFDIDNFKKINDTCGHITGDKILQKTAIIIKKTLRDTDIAGRFGGDEFVLILVQTDIDVGTQVAERIRAKIEQAQIPFKKEQSISFTISLGICQYNDKLKSVQEFITKTDRALYMAKYKGCNCVYRAED